MDMHRDIQGMGTHPFVKRGNNCYAARKTWTHGNPRSVGLYLTRLHCHGAHRGVPSPVGRVEANVMSSRGVCANKAG